MDKMSRHDEAREFLMRFLHRVIANDEWQKQSTLTWQETVKLMVKFFKAETE